jgi:hypothetical protein
MLGATCEWGGQKIREICTPVTVKLVLHGESYGVSEVFYRTQAGGQVEEMWRDATVQALAPLIANST